MAYDIYTFASYSAFYSDYTKHQVYALLSASSSTLSAAVDFVLLRIREFFGNRKLFVLFEDQLGCDPATDHQTPKNVYPLFYDVVEAELGYLKVFEKAALVAHLEATIYATVYEELRMRLQVQKQNEMLEIELTVARYNWEASKEVVSQQSAELLSLRKKMYEFYFMYYQYAAKKRTVGKMYRPDFYVIADSRWEEYKRGTELVVAQLKRQIMVLTGENERLQASLSAAMSSLRDLDVYKDYLLACYSYIGKLNSMLADFNSKYERSVYDYQLKIQVLKDELNRMRAFERENSALKMKLDYLYKLFAAQASRNQQEREENETKIYELNDYIKTLRYLHKYWEKDVKLAKVELADLRERLLYSYQSLKQQKNECERYIALSKCEKKDTNDYGKAKQVLLDVAVNNYVYRDLIEKMTGLYLCLESAEQRKIITQMLHSDAPKTSQDVDAYLSRLQLRSTILSKCHYLFRVQPCFTSAATQYVATEVVDCRYFEAEQYQDFPDANLVNSLLSDRYKQQRRSPAAGVTCNGLLPNEMGVRDMNRAAAQLYQQEAASVSETAADEALYFDELPTLPEDFLYKSRRGNQLIAELDDALLLVDYAKNEALQSLDDHQDIASQTAEDAVLIEPARDSKSQRANACANRILRLSRFTLKYQTNKEVYDIPEVFQRLHNAAREIAWRRDRLREQIELWEKRYFARRNSVQQQGISVSSVLHGSSMMRVSSAKADQKKMSLLYELPSRDAGSAKSQSGLDLRGSTAAKISDRELMEAIFGYSGGTKEANYQISVHASQ